MAESVKGARSTSIDPLVELIETLRGKNGCPWDKKQTPGSMARYLIEEAYELVDAILANNAQDICEEAGDVLFQILFIINLFKENGHFDYQDVIEKNVKKMIHRHPHVFGDVKAETAELVSQNWQKIKSAEKGNNPCESVLDSVPRNMTALIRAGLISERAAKTGFDWDDISGVMEKTMEEWEEFSGEVTPNMHLADKAKATMEFGDILFSMVNVARFAGINPEIALLQSIQKFEKRFRYIEAQADESGRIIDDLTFKEMHQLWDEAKEKIG
ncbi:MazG: nucleoside triphosphate pyrophosphohydrolase [Desulfosarcina variabilis str. Montpellier]|uniref:nucleoside triphosphate pyrophosphohydrolase n=1 Tax=Desulfosarcina variabilis TaxID=2300 RepID=UPI003AFA8286